MSERKQTMRWKGRQTTKDKKRVSRTFYT